MKLTTFLLGLFCSVAAFAQLPDGFTPLFNEQNLHGWKRIGSSIPDTVWQWQNGVLVTTQGPKGGAGWIQYEKKKFTDFMAYYEWKCDSNGNSGFQFHIPENSKQPVWDAIEIQVCEDSTFSWWWEKNGFYKWDMRQISGSVYGFAGADTNVYNGMGKWNTTMVTSIGDTIKVAMNGIEVVNINVNDYNEDVYLWDTRDALSKRPRTGYIGFQSHKGGTTYFRNVGIKDLD